MHVLLLFEHTGLAAKSFTDLGHTVTIVDILNKKNNPWATTTLNWNILEHEDELIALAKQSAIVIGMPPCTDLTVAGAKHFAKKRKANPNFQLDAMHLARSVERIGTAAGVSWIIENPVGVLSTLWRKPDYIISPHEFGGYLPELDIHPLWPKYIAPRDAYTKQTCLWCSADFKLPQKKYIKPEHLGYAVNRQTAYLGGKSLQTKIIRSASPRAFFTALAQQL